MGQKPEEVGPFQPYLDAVIKSGERTRAVIYVTLVVSFFVACGIRNFGFPDWDAKRLQYMQDNYHCVIQADAPDPKCAAVFTGYASQGLKFKGEPNSSIPPSASTPNSTAPISPGVANSAPLNAMGGQVSPALVTAENRLARKLYEDRINELMKADVHENTLQIPVFGVFLDGNDLWLVSGVLMAILMMILAAHMQRELGNFREARSACPNNTCRDLLTMAQIFALPAEDQTPAMACLRHVIFLVLYWLPAVLNLIVFYSDVTGPESNASLIGPVWNNIEYTGRMITVIALCYLSFRCYRLGHELHNFVVRLKVEDFSAAYG